MSRRKAPTAQEPPKRQRLVDRLEQIEKRCRKLVIKTEEAEQRLFNPSPEIASAVEECTNLARAGLPEAEDQEAFLRRIDAALAALDALVGRRVSQSWLDTYAVEGLKANRQSVVAALRGNRPADLVQFFTYAEQTINDRFGDGTTFGDRRQPSVEWHPTDNCLVLLEGDFHGRDWEGSFPFKVSLSLYGVSQYLFSQRVGSDLVEWNLWEETQRANPQWDLGPPRDSDSGQEVDQGQAWRAAELEELLQRFLQVFEPRCSVVQAPTE